ncbi:hypothetical protein LEP3755_38980 [Leptolyngbya sp. NIES-3755]|nr:hypothetical protein LEP3755_38980 [Leptolyngbya sp. NIES-3755]
MSCDTQQSEELTDCLNQIKAFSLQEFDRQIASHQLYYHTRDHIAHVQRRSQFIFETIRTDLTAAEIDQLDRLLDLCVVAHDMIQVFEAQPQPHTARQRSRGISEAATIDHLLDYIDSVCSGTFTESDRAIIRTAINATICGYDPEQQAIYQPALDDPNLSIVARILALADLGALGIDGIEMYNREGSLLFLEENLDVVPLLISGEIKQLEATNPALAENIRQRLLKRCRFQVSLAKSRLARFEHEIEGFPKNAIEKLHQKVFKYLNIETIRELEKTTPISDRSSLDLLLKFYNFEQYLSLSR